MTVEIPINEARLISEDPGNWASPSMIGFLRGLPGDVRGIAQAVSNLSPQISFSTTYDILKPKNGTRLAPETSDDVSEGNPFKTIDVSAWQGKTPPDREWCVPNWIPRGVVTGLGGAGGASKSTLALQTCIHKSLGWPMLGEDIEKGPALFITCEDDEDELHRRTSAIARRMGVEISDFADNVHLVDRVGDESILVEPIAGLLTRTRRYHELDELMGDLKIELCALDLLPDFWVGNESDRGQVNGLVKTHLAYLAKRHNLALVALYHPSVAGVASGSGTSGSTAWEGSFRSRLYLEFKADNSTRTLKRLKANYAPLQDLELIWKDGYMVEPSSLHTNPEDEIAAKWETDFLTAMQFCDKHEIRISAASNSKDSYKKIFPEVLKRIDGRKRWASVPQLEKAYAKAIVGRTIVEVARTNKQRACIRFKGYENGH